MKTRGWGKAFYVKCGQRTLERILGSLLQVISEKTILWVSPRFMVQCKLIGFHAYVPLLTLVEFFNTLIFCRAASNVNQTSPCKLATACIGMSEPTLPAGLLDQ